ncbi:BTB POZ domain-containing [Acanthamoeba polyphaga mimivirus]|uniref:BTB POZ domain-containing n=3 Tax=Megamimivirinae TaxID=3044648 RepID=A0A2L2DIR1_MIMIV|nr:putative BTB/POZ domain-containing protein [Megavirus chiliensis]AEQ33254.1 BTB-POZ domain and tricorn protease domain 2 containing protein [Megavirus chiliensis]AGD92227.1 putative BTB/POZ domain-containing protein [Megavirus lba]AVG46051.1 BTB POZ domain-containing [Acanthamoeba polyphaga mimivirus]AVG47157.1 BTB POZ domain-containing [Acanthamoeba polyphaga mimivirus]
MDYNILYECAKQGLFTDFELTLEDGTNQITMKLHRHILYASSPYFRAMFTNFMDSNVKQKTMFVKNTHIYHDTIVSFYGQKLNSANYPEYKHILESIKCRDFLQLEIDTKILSKLIVPENDFELLLDVADMIGYNENIINAISQNLSINYKIEIFPRELQIELHNNLSDDLIVLNSNDCIYFYDKIGKFISSYKTELAIKNLSCNKFGIICYTNYNDIKVVNMNNNEIITINKDTVSCDEFMNLDISPDGKRILSYDLNGKVYFWNSINGELIHILKTDYDFIYKVCYLPLDDKFMIHTEANVYIHDSNEYHLVAHFQMDKDKCISISPNETKIAMYFENDIDIWNYSTGDTYKIKTENKISLLRFCTNNNYLIMTCGATFNPDCYELRVYDFNAKKDIMFSHETEFIEELAYYTKNNYIITIMSGYRKHELKIYDNHILNDDDDNIIKDYEYYLKRGYNVTESLKFNPHNEINIISNITKDLVKKLNTIILN